MELESKRGWDPQPRLLVTQRLLSYLDGYFSWRCSLDLRQGQSQDTISNCMHEYTVCIDQVFVESLVSMSTQERWADLWVGS